MREYYEAYDDRYAQVHKENLRWFSQERSRILEEVISELGIHSHHRLLEIGCGEGRDSRFLLERCYDLLATDISAEAIAFCKTEYPQYGSCFQILDCLKDNLDENFDFIYAIAVVHMLVLDEDRRKFYQFIHRHLSDNGIALICTMGDGIRECQSDINAAFSLQDRLHEATGRALRIASTSYRAVSFPKFERELLDNGFSVLKKGISIAEPDYGNLMYAVVKKNPA